MIRIIFSMRSSLGSLDHLLRGLVPVALGLLLNGCSTVDYYSQLGAGQWQLLQAREPVADIIDDPARPAALRQRLARAEQARAFASEHLKLPDNGSYRLYADIGRPFVVWNVFATPEFSLNPQTHCFPIAGCVAYRGYYNQGRARGAAALLRQQGLDVYVGGVEAYSTLGWFDDPILNSMASWGDERLATLIFHELAHQRFYVKNDTEFNESFATFVEQEGARQWRRAQGLPPHSDASLKQRDQFTQLVLDTRARLEQLYQGSLSAEQMRAGKAQEIERLRSDYRRLRDTQWGGQGRYDAWIAAPINNAKLLPFGLYDQWVPAFATLFAQSNRDWARFYSQVQRLGAMPELQRRAALQALVLKTPAGSP